MVSIPYSTPLQECSQYSNWGSLNKIVSLKKWNSYGWQTHYDVKHMCETHDVFPQWPSGKKSQQSICCGVEQGGSDSWATLVTIIWLIKCKMSLRYCLNEAGFVQSDTLQSWKHVFVPSQEDRKRSMSSDGARRSLSLIYVLQEPDPAGIWADSKEHNRLCRRDTEKANWTKQEEVSFCINTDHWENTFLLEAPHYTNTVSM